TNVASSFLPGAEMITFLAPASRCAFAFVASVNRPVDSTTTSTPRSFQGSAAGSRSASDVTSWSPILMPPSTTETGLSKRPSIESYFNRCACVSSSPKSLNATISTSAPVSWTARKKLRPIRPNPLIPTRTVTASAPRCGTYSGPFRDYRSAVSTPEAGGSVRTIAYACRVDLFADPASVLDGGLATELERRGNDLSDALWSARLLVDDPEEIRAAHDTFFGAGAVVATTATYQASFDGFAERGIDHRDAARLMRLAVDLA